MWNTTLCYIERQGQYLMLHRVKKENDINKDKWIGIGGKFEDKESPEECLVREVREETGLVVIPDSIREFGSVLRRQKSDKSENTIFEQENFYYICDVEAANIGQELDEYEREAGFVLRVLPIDEAICANDEYHSENYFDEVMIKRELRVLQMVKKQMKL